MKKPDMNLGDVVALCRFCSRDDVALAAAEQSARAQQGQATQLGAILVEHGAITREQLEEALDYQKEVRRSSSSAAKAILRLAEKHSAHLTPRLAVAGGSR